MGMTYSFLFLAAGRQYVLNIILQVNNKLIFNSLVSVKAIKIIGGRRKFKVAL
jgi:hypothetical protein